MTVKFYETKGLTSIHEERHLMMLNLLKNTTCRIIFVISSPLEADIIRYRLYVYAQSYDDPTAEQRLILLDANDSSNRALTEKILENEELMKKMRNHIRNPDKAIMLSYICNPLDEKLRDKLGIKHWFGSAPSSWGTKSGSRQIFKESGVPIADGLMEAAYEEERLENEILALQRKTGAKRIIVKVDDGAGGYGNVVLNFTSLSGQASMEDVKRILRSSVEELLPFKSFLEQLVECGVIIEQMIDPKGKDDLQTTPSVQLYIADLDKVQVLSSHEQVMEGCFYLGCRYPASIDYLDRITAYGKSAGETLARKGVRGFCGVDFLATKTEGSDWDIIALEINLRLCATTFAYFSLLTVVDENLVNKKHYIHLDEVVLSKQFTVPELIHELEKNNLHYDWNKGKGILFSTLSTLHKENEVGLICIGDSIAEVDALQNAFMKEMNATIKSHTKAEEEGIAEVTKSVPRINEQGEVVCC